MPNLRAAASSTRTPSGITSLPMPSPAMTAILYLVMVGPRSGAGGLGWVKIETLRPYGCKRKRDHQGNLSEFGASAFSVAFVRHRGEIASTPDRPVPS